MTTSSPKLKDSRKRLMVAVASLAVAAAVGAGAVATNAVPAFADPVRVDAPQVPSFADVVTKVTPAVVSVRVKEKVQPAADDGSFSFGPDFRNLPPDHPMRKFFRQFRGDQDRDHRPQRRNRGPRPMAQGSGFFISHDGYLVTNNHVVDGGEDFTVVLEDGTEMPAKLIGTDARTDLAVLKIDPGTRQLTYVDFADDSKVRVGDWVVAVGNPFGLGGTVTAGIVSARGRDIGAGPYDDFIQIDAAVNKGNSGGPAFNLSGQVVGINTAIFSPSGGNVGIAFAIPASTAKAVVNDLISHGTVDRGWLGVQIQQVTKEIAESLGLEEAKGALVAGVQDDSPAKKAGIVAGDIVTSVNGKDVASPRELARTVAGLQPGTDIDLGYWHNGKAMSAKVPLGELPAAEKQASADQDNAPAAPNQLADLGLTVTPAEDGSGLVVTDVDPGSDAADQGIRAGDVIKSVNAAPVASAEDLNKAMESASAAGRKAVLLQVARDDNNRFVALPIAKG